MPRTTSSAALTTPAPEATTPHVSASWLPLVTWPTMRTWQGLATEKPPPPKYGDERTLEPRAKCASHLADGGHGHQRATNSSARARG
jgi:hypothetical protein